MSNQISTNGGAQSVASLPPRNCSAFEARILSILSTEKYTTARLLADAVWPRDSRSTGRQNGRWQKMGAVLRKLYEKKLATFRVTDHGQKEWRKVYTPNNH